ncbi:MAG: hypothetical protein ACREAB_01615 [Blastocatellia bacterium]
MNVYDIGDVVRVSATFTNQVGAPVDPGGVTLKVKNPVGVKTSYVYVVDLALIRDSPGNYHLDLEPAIQGVWTYRWEGTAPNKGAEEASFQISESAFD